MHLRPHTKPALCTSCVWFEAAPHEAEKRMPLLAALSSAFALGRAGEGFCIERDRYVRALPQCDFYTPADHNSAS
jgi:hypothetical protein